MLPTAGVSAAGIWMQKSTHCIWHLITREYSPQEFADFEDGKEVEKQELPNDIEMIGDLVRKICSENAVAYFGFRQDKIVEK